MKRSAINFVVDLATALVMLGMIGTGLILRFVLPPGSGSRRVLWSLGRHDWGDVHFWLAVAVGVALLVHVALHWQWVCIISLRMLGRNFAADGHPRPMWRDLAGAAVVCLLIGLSAVFVWVAQAQVIETGSGASRSEPAERGGQAIRGSMTLGEAADALGVSVEILRSKLDLPATVPAEERLGRLRDEYGFTMSQLRDIASDATPKER